MEREEELYELIHVTPLDTSQTSPTAPKMCSQPLLKRLLNIPDLSGDQSHLAELTYFIWVPVAEKSCFTESWNILSWKGTHHKDDQSPTPA